MLGHFPEFNAWLSTSLSVSDKDDLAGDACGCDDLCRGLQDVESDLDLNLCELLDLGLAPELIGRLNTQVLWFRVLRRSVESLGGRMVFSEVDYTTAVHAVTVGHLNS